MKQWIVIIKSIINDIQGLKKPFVFYLTIYLISSILSLMTSIFMTRYLNNPNISFLIVVLIILISLFQYVNIVYFQTAYTKSILIDSEFSGVMKAISQTIKIFVIQMLYVLLFSFIFVLIAISIIFLFKLDILNGMKIIIIPFGFFLFLWMLCLLFVSLIVVNKRDSYKMKDIIKESKYLIRNNMNLLVPILIVQYSPVLYYYSNRGDQEILYPIHYSIQYLQYV